MTRSFPRRDEGCLSPLPVRERVRVMPLVSPAIGASARLCFGTVRLLACFRAPDARH